MGSWSTQLEVLLWIAAWRSKPVAPRQMMQRTSVLNRKESDGDKKS